MGSDHPNKLTSIRVTNQTRDHIELFRFDGENVNDAIARLCEIAPELIEINQGCVTCDEELAEPGQAIENASFLMYRLPEVMNVATTQLYCSPGCFMASWDAKISGEQKATSLILKGEFTETTIAGEFDFKRDGFDWEITIPKNTPGPLSPWTTDTLDQFDSITAKHGKQILDHGEIDSVYDEHGEDERVTIRVSPDIDEDDILPHIEGIA